jgi:hypothetical protein
MRPGYVTECYWPGVRESDVRELDARVRSATAELADTGEPVAYLGSVLILDDEVVLCLFAGPLRTVRDLAERAGVPVGRVLRSAFGE